MLKKVLIIEDNEDNMDLCIMLLDGRYDVIPAFNATSGLAKLESEIPDLILLDLSLPDIDGLEITRRIRSSDSEEIKHIPIVALTAHGLSVDRENALNAGCNYYIEKPFEIKHLLQVIEDYISGKE